ncbi:hypothetical protein V2J09_001375 [Rumex salicifolius]
MMIPGNESLQNSIQAVKDAFSPLESSIKKAAHDFECSWLSLKKPHGEAQLLNGAKDSNLHSCTVRKHGPHSVVLEEGKKGMVVSKIPVKTFLGKEDVSCVNCLQFAMTCWLLPNGFFLCLPSMFKGVKVDNEERVRSSSNKHLPKSAALHKIREKSLGKGQNVVKFPSSTRNEDKLTSLELLIGFIFEQISHNLKKLVETAKEKDKKDSESSSQFPVYNFHHLKAVASILEGKKADFDGFLGNLNFARVGGAPSSLVGVTSPMKEEGDEGSSSKCADDKGGVSPQNTVNGLLSIPLSNVERIRSTISTVSITELIELLPQLGRSAKLVPDKKKLFSVQDFFKYTEAEGRRFFEELDRDGDGQVTLEDLELAMRRRKLPQRYAKDLMQRARSHLFSKSFGWKQFLSVMEQREPTILRAYTSLCLSKSGTLQKSEILESLKNARLPSNEENALAMMRFLNADTGGSISYGHFRNFMLLLPSDRLQDDPRNVWFEAATVVAVPPPVELPATSVLRAALAGGLSCALSTSLLHPVDSIKTRVQSSSLSFPEIISQLPNIGVRALYRGSIPAILGQFTSHGLRTGIFEATKLVLINVAPTLPEFQVQSIASFCSTLLGTATRIPNEVLKQRLQAGLFENVGEAIVGTWQQDGLKGFFRGTGATLCREVPFYVAGMGLYAESKKLAQHLLDRELEPWETIAVGALSGGLAAVVTTPFDVLKTRMMTAPSGRHISTTMIAMSILRHEGPLGLFKGAVPRFFWIAPLGAMNFAGYELAKKAMNKTEEPLGDQLPLQVLRSTHHHLRRLNNFHRNSSIYLASFLNCKSILGSYLLKCLCLMAIYADEILDFFWLCLYKQLSTNM